MLSSFMCFNNLVQFEYSFETKKCWFSIFVHYAQVKIIYTVFPALKSTV